jgi:hypothetical protein
MRQWKNLKALMALVVLVQYEHSTMPFIGYSR